MQSTVLFLVATAQSVQQHQYNQWLLPSLASFWPRNALRMIVALDPQEK